jgi:ABC-type sugar transport system substrate-binding protein
VVSDGLEGGNRPIVTAPTAVLSDGLPAVEVVPRAQYFSQLILDFPAWVAETDIQPSAGRREQVNAIMPRVLERNPSINGTYSAWEPNALDGNDEAFRNRNDTGGDALGRYLPYWTRATGKERIVGL